MIVFLTSSFYFFPFSERVLYYFVDKIFFPQNRSSHLEVFCKKYLTKFTCFGVLSFSKIVVQRPATLYFINMRLQHRCFLVNFGEKNISRKSSIVECLTGFSMRLSLWQVLAGKVNRWKKIEKVINFILETPEKFFFIVFRGVFRTQSNIYDGAFLGK